MKKLDNNEKHSQHFANFINNILPKTEEWTDEEIYQWYIDEYYNIDDIGEDGGEYSTNNPDGFWDYYTIGGRFAGALYLKEGVEYFSTEEHLEYPNYTEDELEELKEERRADCCRLDELDMERLKEDYEKEGIHSFLHYVNVIVRNYELVEFTNPIDYLQELLKSPENGDLRVTVIDYHF